MCSPGLFRNLSGSNRRTIWTLWRGRGTGQVLSQHWRVLRLEECMDGICAASLSRGVPIFWRRRCWVRAWVTWQGASGECRGADLFGDWNWLRQTVPDGGVAADYEFDGVQGVCVPDGDDGAGSSAGVQRWRGTDNVRGPAVRGKQAGGEWNSVVCFWRMDLVYDRLASYNEPSLPSPPFKCPPRQRRRHRPCCLAGHH